MKRILSLLLALLMLAALLTACGNDTVESSGSPSPSASSPATDELDPSAPPSAEATAAPALYTNPLTGLPTESDISGKKPVAVMLNNLKQALPQQGNSQADIIYEVLAEGGITRMLALYQDVSSVGTIASVRSARMYYLELAMGHDAVFVHAGGSPDFYEFKNNSGIFTADGVNGYFSSISAGLFWRDSRRIWGKSFDYEHSLVTSGSAIHTALSEQNRLGDHADGYESGLTFTEDGTPADGQPATIISVPFSNYKTGVFRMEKSTGLYGVEEYDQLYIDGNDNTQVTVTNVLILQADTERVDNDGRLSIDLSSGNGYFACGGKIIPITWSKGDSNSPLRYFTADGEDLVLGQGKSYVCIIPTTREITAQ